MTVWCQNVDYEGSSTLLYLKYVGETIHEAATRAAQHKLGGGAPLFTAALESLGVLDASGVLSAVGDRDASTRKLLEAVWAGLLGVSAKDGTGLNIIKCGRWTCDGGLRCRLMVKYESVHSTPNPEGKGSRVWSLETRIQDTEDREAIAYGEVYGLTYVSEILHLMRSRGSKKGGKVTDDDIFERFVVDKTKELLDANPDLDEEEAEAWAEKLGREGGYDRKQSDGGKLSFGRIHQKRKAPVEGNMSTSMKIATMRNNKKRHGEGAALLQCRKCSQKLGLWRHKMRYFNNLTGPQNPMKKHLKLYPTCRQTLGEGRAQVAANFKNSIKE